jgi:uncharacterized protein YoxC
MNFFDWMNMNMIIDIAFLVFSGAVIWKFRKNQKLVTEANNYNTGIQTKLEMHRIAIVDLMQKTQALEEQVISVTKNPQAARRKLKQNQ